MAPNAGLYIAGTAVSVLGSLFGASKASSAAAEQASLQNEAAIRKLGYDTENWELTKEKILADRQHAVESIDIQAANEQKVAQYQDAVNLQQYNYDMMIRNREQASLNQQFIRSDDIFKKQLTLNALSAQTGEDAEARKLQEIRAEAAFNKQEAALEQLRAQDELRARGVSGRSAAKAGQATLADFGRQMAMINESVDSAGRNARAVLKEIANDKASANLAAYAQKMLDPGILPSPIVPFQTPTATFLYPREFTEGDFGPQPVLGAWASPSAASNKVWGTAISGIAGTVGGAFRTAATTEWS